MYDNYVFYIMNLSWVNSIIIRTMTWYIEEWKNLSMADISIGHVDEGQETWVGDPCG